MEGSHDPPRLDETRGGMVTAPWPKVLWVARGIDGALKVSDDPGDFPNQKAAKYEYQDDGEVVVYRSVSFVRRDRDRP